jgi:DNA-binding MarR family transcriptional regulator/GNAT superfamily N-acetyltransferase
MHVAQVRRFNRVVTQRVGALDESYLARDRPLGECRVLWEIGDGCDVRDLRARLDLDSGYLSRLLGRLQADGLVNLAPSAADRRVRTARLTAAGRRERAELDRRSDELAEALLAPLSEHRRERLVAAMAEVERLLTASLVRIETVDPEDPRARYCLTQYMAEIDARFAAGFDPARSLSAEPEAFRAPAGAMLLATLHGEPVGCGAIKLDWGAPPYIKRMWVSPAARGLGLGKRLLGELEARAEAIGAPVVQLETNAALREAIALYRSAGYREVAPFNDEPYAHHWFEKALHPGTPR